MRTVQMGSALPETAPRIAVLASAALSFRSRESVPVAGVQQGDETAHVRCVEFEQRTDGTRKVEHATSGDSYSLWIDGGGAGDGP